MRTVAPMRLTHVRIRVGRGTGTTPAAALAAVWSAALTMPVAPQEWRPPCDVLESADAWTVHAELGGLADDEIEILLYEDSVVVQGVRPWRGASAAVHVHLAELRYGPFRLRLDLPAGVDRDAVRTSYDRGILTLVLPKTGSGTAP